MKLRYTEQATADLRRAFTWYERQRSGLGKEFLNCVEDGLATIMAHPELYAIQHGPFRRCLIRRFPFALFYTLEAQEIIVHAVFDNRQNPENRPSSC